MIVRILAPDPEVLDVLVLWEAVRDLDPIEREVLDLRLGLAANDDPARSPRETARILGTTPRYVEAVRRGALAKLRTALAE